MHLETTITKNEETTLSAAVSLAADKAAYDAACKRILAEKRILAWILKECASEFSSCALEDIETRYIEGTPQIGEAAVLPDEASLIRGENTEDKSMTEGTVTYDVRFRAIAPKEDGCITLLVNAEGQKDYAPGYPLTKRGIYYCSRMISSQYGREFTHGHYEKLKKVYSIWICLDPPKQRQNTITRYRMEEDSIAGTVKEPRENYDLLTLVMVCLGRKEEGKNRLLQMLDVLFSQEPQEKKREILETEFSLPMTQALEKEVTDMCNFSDVIERRGIEQGIEQGLSQGISQGLEQGLSQGRQAEKLDTARRMREQGLELELICACTGLPDQVVESL